MKRADPHAALAMPLGTRARASSRPHNRHANVIPPHRRRTRAWGLGWPSSCPSCPSSCSRLCRRLSPPPNRQRRRLFAALRPPRCRCSPGAPSEASPCAPGRARGDLRWAGARGRRRATGVLPCADERWRSVIARGGGNSERAGRAGPAPRATTRRRSRGRTDLPILARRPSAP